VAWHGVGAAMIDKVYISSSLVRCVVVADIATAPLAETGACSSQHYSGLHKSATQFYKVVYH